MKNSQDLLKKADIIPYLKLGIKLEGGGTKSTGSHKVKLISDSVFEGKDFYGNPQQKLRIILEEDGQKKKYDTAINNKQGDLSYLVQKLAEFNEGDEIVMEYVKNGAKGFIDVRKAGDEAEIPIIDEPPIEEPIREEPPIEEPPEDLL